MVTTDLAVKIIFRKRSNLSNVVGHRDVASPERDPDRHRHEGRKAGGGLEAGRRQGPGGRHNKLCSRLQQGRQGMGSIL